MAETVVEYRANLGQGTVVPLPTEERCRYLLATYHSNNPGGFVERRTVTTTDWEEVEEEHYSADLAHGIEG